MKRRLLKCKSKPKSSRRKIVVLPIKGDIDDYIFSCSYNCTKKVSER